MELPEVFELDSLPTPEYEIIPAGQYAAMIAAAEARQNKSGTGHYLSIQYLILGPSHEGRSVFSNITLSHPNETATRIGRGQLSELMRAIGVSRLADTEQLVGRRLKIKVVVRADEKYGETNEVRGWKPLEGGQQASSPIPPFPPAPTLASTQPPALGNAEMPRPRSVPPWAAK
jgi:hypothetical protein